MTLRLALRATAAAAAALLALAGCSTGSEEPEAEATAAAGADGFPVTVATAFGDVTVEEEPQRVVALGWSDAETALALGVQPVGATDWLGFGGEGVGPWAEGLYEEAPEILPTTDLDPEAVAALQPDLILDTRQDGDQARYDALSQIAPVVGPPEGVIEYGTTWQQQVDLVAQALGRTEEGEQLTEETEAAIAEAREAHPGFEGTEVAVGAYFAGQYGAYVRGDSRVDLMEQLGFTNSPEVEALADGSSFYVNVARERLDVLDADLSVVFPIGDVVEELRGDELLQGIGSAQAGRLVVLEDPALVNAFSSGSALGIRYAVEEAVPLFAQALA
ncbi:iron-siderophore ABC transporter substrate-binding protein [Vallicoccus soli]|uniref:Iron-siderophore ABC transporter substrate-binding protein n=1 Tax=Vallicoccus soli TaxID=2339232 RepID=A0A3A3YYW2_9ACTN|nr:iron-siderophore ABC transporter substrate-binding protein [Vallicoccus soli]RJK96920.1 iron-siderophore ABC transporter substrate-binding protein [Vallicoccus soli]